MIVNITPIAVGNALRVFLEPSATALSWALLRNSTGTFSGPTDPSSVVVFHGNSETVVLDADHLLNGVTVYYGVFYFDGSEWTTGNVASGTPHTTYADQSIDVLTIVRERLDWGLQAEVSTGTLSPAMGVIAVLNAPPVFEQTSWPVVTVHVASDASGVRAVGEMPFPDVVDAESGTWIESQGWLARVQLTIVGWSKNADERIALRKALRKIVLGNLEVFDSFGLINIDFSQQDIDELSAYPAPVYQSYCTFSCQAPAGVADTVAPTTYAPQTNITPVF
jgi:hypothetical protein